MLITDSFKSLYSLLSSPRCRATVVVTSSGLLITDHGLLPRTPMELTAWLNVVSCEKTLCEHARKRAQIRKTSSADTRKLYVTSASFSLPDLVSPNFETQVPAIMVKKILCLHGQGTSGSIFKSQSGSYLSQVGPTGWSSTPCLYHS